MEITRHIPGVMEIEKNAENCVGILTTWVGVKGFQCMYLYLMEGRGGEGEREGEGEGEGDRERERGRPW